MTERIEQGVAAETLACRYLEGQGLRLLQRNYHCRLGELDLIMVDGDLLVFVEVRSRRQGDYASPAETVTLPKQRRLIRTAAHYLQRTRSSAPCRFDVVAIIQAGGEPVLEWIRDAFQVR
jgi:putative endonuclease